MKAVVVIIVTLLLPVVALCSTPAPIIFDTDIGNDIDDALALGVIHALQSRGECKLLAVTITKDNPWSAPFVDLVDTFYGRGDIPIGVVHNGKTPNDSRYLMKPAKAMDDGRPRYPHDLQSGKDAPEAVALLRKTLASQPDGSVVIVQVGLSTNLARLLASRADENSSLTGIELITSKCRLLSMMGGCFLNTPRREYNIFSDLDASRELLRDWPTPIVLSGAEIGEAILYPATSIEKDFSYVAHHPLAEAYKLYMKFPYDRPCWDLTSVLYAVRPDRGYFDLSPSGNVRVDEKEVTQFTPAPNGKCRYLILTPEQRVRVREALVELASQPPDHAERQVATTRSLHKKIDSFQGEYRFLSNFWPAGIEFEGRSYHSAEHAYQAAKFTDEVMRQRVADAPTPAAAKSIAHSATTQRADWDNAKFEVMEAILREKFTRHADLRQKLLDTGDAELIEGNTWGDRVWGVCDGEGENHLGKLLMKIREELRDQSDHAAQNVR